MFDSRRVRSVVVVATATLLAVGCRRAPESPPEAIAGVVRDETGTPTDGATIQILPIGDWSLRKYAAGRFEVFRKLQGSTEQGPRYHLVARHEERNLAVGMEIKEDANTLDVRLKPGVILAGKVVGPDGKGIEGATVVMTNLQTSDWSGRYLSWMEADAEGRFEFRALPPRYDYVLSARKVHYRVGQTEVRCEDVRDNRVDGVSIVLPRGEFSVSGVVVDANGKPVPNVWVYCTGKGQAGINSHSDAEGRFKADGIFEGQVDITASIQGNDGRWLGGSISVEAGATNVKIVLDSNGVRPPKGRTCFPADTEVRVEGELMQVSQVTEGRTVGRLCPATTGDSFGQVEEVEEHLGAFECRDIVFGNGNRISVVGAHCFMLDSGQWIAAHDLRSGLNLKTLDGTVTIRSVTTRATPYVGKVCNLKIENCDRYAVGRDSVIVRDY